MYKHQRNRNLLVRSFHPSQWLVSDWCADFLSQSNLKGIESINTDFSGISSPLWIYYPQYSPFSNDVYLVYIDNWMKDDKNLKFPWYLWAADCHVMCRYRSDENQLNIYKWALVCFWVDDDSRMPHFNLKLNLKLIRKYMLLSKALGSWKYQFLLANSFTLIPKTAEKERMPN